MKVLTWSNDAVAEVDLIDYTLDKTILLCSVCRIAENLTERYVEFLASKSEEYKNHGIDQIVLINSCDGKFSLARLKRIAPSLTAFADNELNFVTWLAQKFDKKEDMSELSRYWSYQALFSFGQLQKFYEQPTSDHRKHLIRSLLHDRRFVLEAKELLKNSDDLIFKRSVLMPNKEQRYEFGGKMFYYNLWPNIELERFISQNH